MQSVPILTLTKQATADLTAEHFVGYDGAPATAGGISFGVSRENASAGGHVPVDVQGTAIVVTGAAVAMTDAIEVGAGGTAVPKTTGVTVARPLEPADAAGKRIEVLLIGN